MAEVAFLGLGVMGYPMAGHLKGRGGHDVVVYNRTAAQGRRYGSRKHGGASAATPARSGARAARSSSPASATTTICAR